MTPEESNRLQELEQRVARLEGLLSSLPQAVTPAAPAVAQSAPVPSPVVHAVVTPEQFAPVAAQVAPVERNVAPAAAPRVQVPPVNAPQRTAPANSDLSFEKRVGLQWAGCAGAVALAISIGLAIKFAVDNGLFERIPPGVRVLFGAFCGFALIGLGEWVYRKVNHLSASGLFGAGVATLFVSAYAGHAFYGLYPPSTAFWFSGLAMLIGAALSMRGNLALVAFLSILGGTMAPALLSTGQTPGLDLFAYAMVLQVLALFLAWWGCAPKWWALRLLAFISTVVWFSVTLSYESVGRPVALAVVVLGAELFQAELVASAMRSSLMNATRGALAQVEDTTAALLSTVVTLMLTIAGMWLLRGEPDSTQALFAFALAVFFGAQSVVLPRMLGTCMKPLANGFQVQAVLLSLMAIPLALHPRHNAIAMGWAMAGVAFAYLAKGKRVFGALFFSTLALVLGSMLWGIYELNEFFNPTEGRIVLLNGYMAAGVVLVAAHVVCGYLVESIDGQNNPPKRSALSVYLWMAAIMVFLFGGSCEIRHYFHPGAISIFNFPAAEQVALSVFWALSSIAMIVLGFGLKRAPLRFGGLALFGLTLLKVVLVDGSFLSSGYRIVSFLGVGALLLVTSVLYGRYKAQ